MHIPRCGGSTLCATLKRLKFHPKTNNGNPVDEEGKLVQFQHYSREKLLEFTKDVDIICNEMYIGGSFFPDDFTYVILLRDPRDRFISDTVNYFFMVNKRPENPQPNEYFDFLRSQNLSNHKNFMTRSIGHNRDTVQERLEKSELVFMDTFAQDVERVFGVPVNRKDHQRYCLPKLTFGDFPKDLEESIGKLLESDIEMYNYAQKFRQ